MSKTFMKQYKSLKDIIFVLNDYDVRWDFYHSKRRIRREMNDLIELDETIANQLSMLMKEMEHSDRKEREEKLPKLKLFVEEKLQPLLQPFLDESYHYLLIDGMEFKAKAINVDRNSIYYGIFSFKTKQHAKSLIALINDGKSFTIRDQFYSYMMEGKIEHKNSYKLQLIEADGPNNDGYHGRLFLDKENIIRYFDDEEPKYYDLFDQEHRIIDRFYYLMKNTKKVAILDLPRKETKAYQTLLENVNVEEDELIEIVKQWKKFFYDKFSGNNIGYKNRRYGKTEYLPQTYYIRNAMISEQDIRDYRTEALKMGTIKLPIEEVEVDKNMSFLDIITKFVLKDIDDEDYHYNIGDELESIIQSEISLDNGKVSHLFGKQQIIGQGMKNAMVNGENVIFLNGGTGVGKTFTSAKTSLQYLDHVGKLNGDAKFRVAIYAQGHIIPKWKREITQAIKVLGIKPIFKNINYLQDVDRLPKEPSGAEFLFFSKDKAKRSYSIKYVPEYQYPTLEPIDNFISKYKKYEDKDLINRLGVLYDKFTIINAEQEIKSNQLKYAALRLGRKIKKHVLIYKPIGKDKYVFSTSIKRFNDHFSKKNNIKFIRTRDINKPINLLLSPKNMHILDNTETLNEGMIKNPLVCPDCGQPIFSVFNNRFKDGKKPRYRKYTTRSSANSTCNAPLHPDGKPFSEEFMRLIKSDKDYKLKKIKELDDEMPLFLDEKKEAITDEEHIRKLLKGIPVYDYRYVYVNYKQCDHILWAADLRDGKRDKMRNVNVGKHLKRKFRNKKFIDILIADECHIYSKQSNQGYLYHLLVQQSQKTLNLSATITGGKASDLYYMFWRTLPQKMRKMGYTYDDYVKFVENYGRYEKKALIEAEDKANKSGTIKRNYGKKEIPGISPALYTNFLNNIMVSRKLPDMDIPMVKLDTFKDEVTPDPDVLQGYDLIKEKLLDFGKRYKVNIGGAFLHGLLSYLDNPNQPPITFKNLDKIMTHLNPKEYKKLKELDLGFEIVKPPHINLKDRFLNKEKALLKIMKKEINQEGRKMLIYDRYSGTKGVSNRIEEVVKKAGFKVIQLKSSVPTNKREEWIERKSQEGYDVIITNPKIVQTGLDLIQYPTIYFYNYDFDVKIIRQAEKRAWRPNQTKECRIYYSYYKDTIQEQAIQLIAKKKSASLALEGVFNEDMLSSMGSADGSSISKQLYDALKGKISLKENHLDSLNIKSSKDLVINLDKSKENSYNKEVVKADNETRNQVRNQNEKECFVTDDFKKIVGEQISFF